MSRNPTPTYPDWMSMVITALPLDGKPIELDFKTNANAHAQRLQMYNFLKWCRRPRNAMSVAHLAGKFNFVTMSIKESKIVFQLRTGLSFKETNDDIARQLAAQGVPAFAPPPSANANAYQAPRALGDRNPQATPVMPDFGLPNLADELPFDAPSDVMDQLHRMETNPVASAPTDRKGWLDGVKE